MTERSANVNEIAKDEWRELGFYYDLDMRPSVNSWRFYGSKQGLGKFVQVLENYASTPSNTALSEHEHYGPYMYLKIMTWSEEVITDDCIAGTFDDLNRLGRLISEKLDKAAPGQTFDVAKDYGVNNTVSALFFVMADDFDPVSLDELIVSGRQDIVNELNSKKYR